MPQGFKNDPPYIIVEAFDHSYSGTEPRVFTGTGFEYDLDKAKEYQTWEAAATEAQTWHSVNVITKQLLTQLKVPRDAVRIEQERIAKLVMEYPAGCADGKRTFLEDAGLPSPKRTYNINIDVVFEVDADEPLGQDTEVADRITRHVKEQYGVTSANRTTTTLVPR